MSTVTDGRNSDVCNLADFSSEDEGTSDEWNFGCQREITDEVTVRDGGDLNDLEDSEEEDPDDIER